MLILKGIARTEFGTSTIRHSQFSKFDVENDEYISHHSGDILVETTSNAVKVVAGKHTIQVSPNSIVLISKDDQMTKVIPLYQNRSCAVTVTTASLCTRVFSGQELIFADEKASVQRIVESDSIGRRKTHLDTVPNIGAVHRCEVSAISLIENNYILTKLVQSSQAADKKLTGKLVKVAASLMTVTSSHGPYSVTSGR